MTSLFSPRSSASLGLLVAILLGSAAFAAEKAAAAPTTDKSSYPLKTCVVSGESLDDGDMGGPVDYLYKQTGQPDRLVRFCCKSCVRKFEKDPAKYLKKLDEAAAAAAPTKSATKP